MKLTDLNLELNEAIRRDLYGQLHNKVLMTVDGEELFMQMANHLGDERDNGEARGDHVSPNELKSNLKKGMKKLIDKYGIDKLYSGNLKKYNAAHMSAKDKNNSAMINFKLKKDKVVKINNKRKKIPLYSTVIVSFYEIIGKRKVVNVVTVYEPRREKRPRVSSRFYINLF